MRKEENNHDTIISEWPQLSSLPHSSCIQAPSHHHPSSHAFALPIAVGKSELDKTWHGMAWTELRTGGGRLALVPFLSVAGP